MEKASFDSIKYKVNGNGCWEVISHKKNSNGYIRFTEKGIAAHRLAYEKIHGKIPDGLFVCHRCDNRSCINPDHLFLGTRQDNVDDMVSKKRHPHCENHPKAKLTWKDVQYIRDNAILARRYMGSNVLELSEQFGVSRHQIYMIVKGHHWLISD